MATGGLAHHRRHCVPDDPRIKRDELAELARRCDVDWLFPSPALFEMLLATGAPCTRVVAQVRVASCPSPEPSTLFSNDVRRDETKREESPPSSFFAQSQGILLAARYFENLHSGYPGAALKHLIRIRSALLAQLMSSFEFTVKDFLAQAVDATHIFDREVKNWGWINVDVATVLSTRDGPGKLGGVLIHPSPGWQTPGDLNRRYKDVFRKPLVWVEEEQTLQQLWIVRHTVVHNGGFVTAPDARRLKSSPLAGKQVLIDLPDEVGELATTAPVHHISGSGDEAVKRHTPVHDHLAVSGGRIAHPVPHRDSLRGRTPQEAAGYRFLAKPGPTALLLLSKSSTLDRHGRGSFAREGAARRTDPAV